MCLVKIMIGVIVHQKTYSKYLVKITVEIDVGNKMF
jgi:hypothetical protein